MRPVYVTVGMVVLVVLGNVAAASPPTMEQLFTPNPSGCIAADAGALDLSVKITGAGTTIGLQGSGLVSGFRSGDVLTFVRTSKAGQGALRDRLSLAALLPGKAGGISVVFALDDVVLDSTCASQDTAKFVVPAEGATWALFTSGMGDGEGEYSVTVRCEPGSPSRSLSTS
jgi:hypothetical protein